MTMMQQYSSAKARVSKLRHALHPSHFSFCLPVRLLFAHDDIARDTYYAVLGTAHSPPGYQCVLQDLIQGPVPLLLREATTSRGSARPPGALRGGVAEEYFLGRLDCPLPCRPPSSAAAAVVTSVPASTVRHVAVLGVSQPCRYPPRRRRGLEHNAAIERVLCWRYWGWGWCRHRTGRRLGQGAAGPPLSWQRTAVTNSRNAMSLLAVLLSSDVSCPPASRHLA